MEEILRIAKTYLAAGEFEKAFSLLKEAPQETVEYEQLLKASRDGLSKQYVDTIRGFLAEGRKKRGSADYKTISGNAG